MEELERAGEREKSGQRRAVDHFPRSAGHGC
jgi:hypothetical protein